MSGVCVLDQTDSGWCGMLCIASAVDLSTPQQYIAASFDVNFVGPEGEEAVSGNVGAMGEDGGDGDGEDDLSWR